MEGEVRTKGDLGVTIGVAPSMKPPDWTTAEDAFLREHYKEKGSIYCANKLERSKRAVQARAHKLGVKGHGYRGHRVNEERVLTLYREVMCASKVARILKVSKGVVLYVLRKHDAVLEEFHSIDRHREAISRDYADCLLTLAQIAAKHDISVAEINRAVRRWQIAIPNRRLSLLANGVFRPNSTPIYECWVRRYGKEEADRKWTECCKRRKIVAPRGAASATYGKPAPQGSGNGWKGWYRGHYFRSLREACYMLGMDKAGVKWVTGEALSIPYVFRGTKRTYRPDYIVGARLIEVKPTRLHGTPAVSAKRAGAEAYCAAQGLTYELVDVSIDSAELLSAWSRGLLRFDRDYETRFLDYVAASGGLVAY
jgi:hypothetical protein